MGNRQALWYEGKSCLGMLFLGGVVWLGLALGFPWKSVEAHRASQDESEQKLLRRIDGLAESLTRMAPEKTYEGYQAIPLELRREVYVRLTPEAKARFGGVITGTAWTRCRSIPNNGTASTRLSK